MGRLVARLKQAGLYDSCLIVVMADHGVSIRPDDDRRNLTETNYPDILSIPLLVKRPGQRRGETSDRNVQSVDVLPTVADVLGIELPWKPDGISAFDASRPEPARKEISREEEWKDRATFDAKSWGQAEARRRLLAVSRDDGTLRGLFRLGPKPEWVGRSAARLALGPPSPCRAELVHRGTLRRRAAGRPYAPLLSRRPHHPRGRAELALGTGDRRQWNRLGDDANDADAGPGERLASRRSRGGASAGKEPHRGLS